jgi:hypothetical protein
MRPTSARLWTIWNKRIDRSEGKISPHSGRRLLRQRPNHPPGTRKDQTRHHQTTTIATPVESRLNSSPKRARTSLNGDRWSRALRRGRGQPHVWPPHSHVREQHRWLRQVLNGHYQYFGVIFNYRSLRVFNPRPASACRLPGTPFDQL